MNFSRGRSRLKILGDGSLLLDGGQGQHEVI